MKTSAKVIGGIITVILLSTSISQCVGSLYRAKLRDDRRIAMQNKLSRLNQTNSKLEAKDMTESDDAFDITLRQIEEDYRRMLPTKTDNLGRTDSVRLLPNREFKIYLTVVNDEWTPTEAEQKQRLLDESKQLPSMGFYRRAKVTLTYAYYRNGQCFMIIKLLPGEY